MIVQRAMRTGEERSGRAPAVFQDVREFPMKAAELQSAPGGLVKKYRPPRPMIHLMHASVAVILLAIAAWIVWRGIGGLGGWSGAAAFLCEGFLIVGLAVNALFAVLHVIFIQDAVAIYENGIAVGHHFMLWGELVAVEFQLRAETTTLDTGTPRTSYYGWWTFFRKGGEPIDFEAEILGAGSVASDYLDANEFNGILSRHVPRFAMSDYVIHRHV